MKANSEKQDISVSNLDRHKRQFIVHFGAHKTGTTAFQHFLQDNREALLASGLYIPRIPEEYDGNYRGLVRAMAGEYDKYPDKARSRMQPLDPVRPNSAGNDILISSEYLSGHNFRPSLGAFAEAIDAIGLRKVAILVIRDQVSWFNSRYSQKRKVMNMNDLSFEQYVNNLMSKAEGNWAQLCRRLTECGFDVFLVANNKTFQTRGVVKSLFETAPLKPYKPRVKFAKAKIHNTSFGAKQQILADLIRSHVEDTLGLPTHKVDRKLLYMIMANKFEKRLDDVPYNGFTSDFRNQVMDHFEKKNEKVAKLYFKTSWSNLFPEKTLAEVSPETLSDLPFREQKILKYIARTTINQATRRNVFKGK